MAALERLLGALAFGDIHARDLVHEMDEVAASEQAMDHRRDHVTFMASQGWCRARTCSWQQRVTRRCEVEPPGERRGGTCMPREPADVRRVTLLRAAAPQCRGDDDQ